MSQTEHETILHDSQQIPDMILEQVQQQNQNTTTFDDTSTVPDDTTTDTQSLSVTSDSNILNTPTRQITENDTVLSHNDNDNASLQKDTSTINMQNTTTTPPQAFSQQVQETYDPPSIPPEFSTHKTPCYSPEQGSSNTNISIALNYTQTQSQQTAPTRQTTLRTPPYIPAQTSITQQTISIFTTFHANPQLHPTISKKFSKHTDPPFSRKIQTLPHP